MYIYILHIYSTEKLLFICSGKITELLKNEIDNNNNKDEYIELPDDLQGSIPQSLLCFPVMKKIKILKVVIK